MLDNMYDNGGLLLGDINTIINELETLEDMDNLLKDLKELRDKSNAKIVMINYDTVPDYIIEYWTNENKIN